MWRTTLRGSPLALARTGLWCPRQVCTLQLFVLLCAAFAEFYQGCVVDLTDVVRNFSKDHILFSFYFSDNISRILIVLLLSHTS